MTLQLRFKFLVTASWTIIQELKNSSNNENTVKSTAFWLSVWKKWCLEKRIAEEIENYLPAELNTLLERFYAEQKKKKHSEDYEPASLKVMIASLDRHLKNKGYGLSIVRDKQFSSYKQVLASAHTKIDSSGIALTVNDVTRNLNRLTFVQIPCQSIIFIGPRIRFIKILI